MVREDPKAGDVVDTCRSIINASTQPKQQSRLTRQRCPWRKEPACPRFSTN